MRRFEKLSAVSRQLSARGEVKRVVAGVVGMGVALLGVELGVRVLAPQAVSADPPPLLRGMLTDPGDHRVRTDEVDVTVHVNARGFVDREWGAKTGKRVVLIGDSFVQAAQVAPGEGVGAVLDEVLDGVEVLSMGVPGAGTATELGVLERYALPMEPDLVVLGFLVANDVLNNHPLLEGKDDKPFYALQGGELVPVDAVTLSAGPLWRVSHAWRWIARTGAVRRAAARKLALGQGMPIDLRVHDPAAGPVWEEAWAVTDALVARMASETKLVVVLFPDRVQATGRSDWPAAEGWDFARAQDRALAMAKAHAPVLDLLPTFRGHGEDFLAKDGHWTASGHRRAAEAMASFVREALP